MVVLAFMGAHTASALGAPGDLDPSFSEDGLIDLPTAARVDRVALRSDGSIVLLGEWAETGPDVATARVLHPDGQVDAAFGEGGVVALPFPFRFLGALKVDAQDRILISGESEDQFHVARYTPDGQPDPTFGVSGVVRVPSLTRAADMHLLPDGRILVATGVVDEGAAAVRLDSQGQLDPTFGNGGIALWGSGAVVADQIEVQGDGRIVLAVLDGVVRYLADGTPDASFGLVTKAGVGSPYAAAVRPNGSIAVAYNSFHDPRFCPCPSAFQVPAIGGAFAAFPFIPGLAGFVPSTDGGLYLSSTYRSLLKGLPPSAPVLRLTPGDVPDPAFGRGGYSVAYSRLKGTAPADIVVNGPSDLVAVLFQRRLDDAPRWLVARMELEDGPSDPDADGVPGDADRCPYGYSIADSGCPRVERLAKLKRRQDSRGRPAFWLTTRARGLACEQEATVRLFRKRPGPDKLQAKRTPRSSDLVVFRRPGPGRYYGRVSADVTGLASCSASKTNTLIVKAQAPAD